MPLNTSKLTHTHLLLSLSLVSFNVYINTFSRCLSLSLSLSISISQLRIFSFFFVKFHFFEFSQSLFPFWFLGFFLCSDQGHKHQPVKFTGNCKTHPVFILYFSLTFNKDSIKWTTNMFLHCFSLNLVTLVVLRSCHQFILCKKL